MLSPFLFFIIMKHLISINGYIYDVTDFEFNKIIKLVKEKDEKELKKYVNSIENSHNPIVSPEFSINTI